MPFGQISITGGQTGQQLVFAGQPATLQNTGPGVVWLSSHKISSPGDPNKQSPLAVNAVLSFDGSEEVWGACAGTDTATINAHPGGTNFFKPSRAVASAVIQATAPASPNVGDIWFDSSLNNEMFQWSGSAWVAVQFGTDAIQAGSVTAALIAAGTIVAGIINGTTVNAATFTGSKFEGNDFEITSLGEIYYQGTPAFGNILYSISAGGTDAYGNTVLPGFTIYLATNAPGIVNAFNIDLTASTQDIGTITFFQTSGGYGGTYSAAYEVIFRAAGIEFTGSVAFDVLSQWLLTNAGGPIFSATTTVATNNALFLGVGTVANDNMFTSKVSGDGYSRYRVNADGKILWGPGNLTQDSRLYRSAAGLLAVSQLTADISGTAETWHSFTPAAGTGASCAYRLNVQGDLQLSGQITYSSPSSPTTIFTLPSGYFSPTQAYGPILLGVNTSALAGGAARITLSTGGVLQYFGPSGSSGAGTITLDGITFPISAG